MGSGDERVEERQQRVRSSSSQSVRARGARLGDLGDELARTIAGSLFVAECSELSGWGLLTEGHLIEAQCPRLVAPSSLSIHKARHYWGLFMALRSCVLALARFSISH